MRFFTSDTHFGHTNIIRYCNRPFSDFEQMDLVLANNWNEQVGPTDVVYHLGDVAMGASERWHDILTSLNGYKILVVGNHDRIFGGMSERQIAKFEERYFEWFDEVYDQHDITLSNGEPVYLSHFPYDGDSHDGDRYTEFRLPDDGITPLIHGHTHSTERVSFSKAGTKQIHVGVDAWDYRPVSENDVIHLLEG